MSQRLLQRSKGNTDSLAALGLTPHGSVLAVAVMKVVSMSHQTFDERAGTAAARIELSEVSGLYKASFVACLEGVYLQGVTDGLDAENGLVVEVKAASGVEPEWRQEFSEKAELQARIYATMLGVPRYKVIARGTWAHPWRLELEGSANADDTSMFIRRRLRQLTAEVEQR